MISISLLIVSYRIMGNLSRHAHPESMPCNNCHLVKGEINKKNANILISTQEILCKSCHENAITASHPSGIKPSHVPPKEFPLDWKGDLTCSTCHSIHSRKKGLPRVDKFGKALCMSCHDKQFFKNMKDGGISILLSGHVDARESLSGDIDSFSIQCLVCHESQTDSLRVKVSANVMRHGENKFVHPVGMQYEKSTSFGGYRSAMSLPSKIQLPDGKVSCISCHESYSETHGQLVMDNAGEALCFSCHDT